MEKLGGFLVRHPVAVGLLFAGLAGFSTYNAFWGGVRFAELRASVGEQARTASEALGG